MGIFSPPDPPPKKKPLIDVSEKADIDAPVPDDGGESARERVRKTKSRTGRQALRIPLGKKKGSGVSIPTQ